MFNFSTKTALLSIGIAFAVLIAYLGVVRPAMLSDFWGNCEGAVWYGERFLDYNENFENSAELQAHLDELESAINSKNKKTAYTTLLKLNALVDLYTEDPSPGGKHWRYMKEVIENGIRVYKTP